MNLTYLNYENEVKVKNSLDLTVYDILLIYKRLD